MIISGFIDNHRQKELRRTISKEDKEKTPINDHLVKKDVIEKAPINENMVKKDAFEKVSETAAKKTVIQDIVSSVNEESRSCLPDQSSGVLSMTSTHLGQALTNNVQATKGQEQGMQESQSQTMMTSNSAHNETNETMEYSSSVQVSNSLPMTSTCPKGSIPSILTTSVVQEESSEVVEYSSSVKVSNAVLKTSTCPQANIPVLNNNIEALNSTKIIDNSHGTLAKSMTSVSVQEESKEAMEYSSSVQVSSTMTSSFEKNSKTTEKTEESKTMTSTVQDSSMSNQDMMSVQNTSTLNSFESEEKSSEVVHMTSTVQESLENISNEVKNEALVMDKAETKKMEELFDKLVAEESSKISKPIKSRSFDAVEKWLMNSEAVNKQSIESNQIKESRINKRNRNRTIEIAPKTLDIKPMALENDSFYSVTASCQNKTFNSTQMSNQSNLTQMSKLQSQNSTTSTEDTESETELTPGETELIPGGSSIGLSGRKPGLCLIIDKLKSIETKLDELKTLDTNSTCPCEPESPLFLLPEVGPTPTKFGESLSSAFYRVSK